MNIKVTFWESEYIEQEMEIQEKDLMAFLEKPTPYLTGTYQGRVVSLKSEQINSIVEI